MRKGNHSVEVDMEWAQMITGGRAGGGTEHYQDRPGLMLDDELKKKSTWQRNKNNRKEEMSARGKDRR